MISKIRQLEAALKKYEWNVCGFSLVKTFTIVNFGTQETSVWLWNLLKRRFLNFNLEECDQPKMAAQNENR